MTTCPVKWADDPVLWGTFYLITHPVHFVLNDRLPCQVNWWPCPVGYFVLNNPPCRLCTQWPLGLTVSWWPCPVGYFILNNPPCTLCTQWPLALPSELMTLSCGGTLYLITHTVHFVLNDRLLCQVSWWLCPVVCSSFSPSLWPCTWRWKPSTPSIRWVQDTFFIFSRNIKGIT